MIEWLKLAYEKARNFSFKTKWSATVYPAAQSIYVMRKRFYNKSWRIVHIQKVIKR